MMFQGRHFQNAYITRDLDKQAQRLNALGVRQHLITEADMEVKTRNGTARMANKIYFGWVGDLQYELIDWTAIGTPETSSQMSLTLALALPESGGGLHVWNINRMEILRLPEDERRAHMQANRIATHQPYVIGSLALHSGHRLHQIAPTPAPRPGDQRLTLQAHGLRVDGRWLLYW